MAASVQPPPSAFDNLPLEVRQKIWTLLLPEHVGPSLFLYQPDCWRSVLVGASDGDAEYDADDYTYNRHVAFCSYLLTTEVPTVLASVNSDARCVANIWARREGFTISDRNGFPIFSIPFDINSDILRLTTYELMDYYHENMNMWMDETLGRHQSIRTFVKNLAISEELFRRTLEFSSFDRIFRGNPLQKLIIITNTTTESRCEDKLLTGQRRWEIDDKNGGAFIWHNNAFTFHGSKYAGKEELYELIEKEIKALAASELNDRDLDIPFKVQVALAIDCRL